MVKHDRACSAVINRGLLVNCCGRYWFVYQFISFDADPLNKEKKYCLWRIFFFSASCLCLPPSQPVPQLTTSHPSTSHMAHRISSHNQSHSSPHLIPQLTSHPTTSPTAHHISSHSSHLIPQPVTQLTTSHPTTSHTAHHIMTEYTLHLVPQLTT